MSANPHGWTASLPASTQRRWGRLVDAVIGARTSGDDDLVAVARLCLMVPLATAAIGLVHAVALPDTVPGMVCTAPLHLLALAAVRLRAPGAALHLSLTALLLFLGVLSWHAGGFGAPASWCLPLIPALPLLVSWYRTSALWAAIVGGTLAAFAWIGASGIPTPQGYTGAWAIPTMAFTYATLAIANVTLVARINSGREELEERLREARERLVSLADAKRTFAATMSHELRTPMNGVIGLSGLLLQTRLDERQREYATTIRSSARALHRIVNDILDFSDLERGGIKIEPVPFELETLVRQVLDVFEVAARHKGLRLRLTIDPDVPRRVVGDDGRVRQVLYNIVSNAVKFTKEGWVSVQVSCLGETPGRALVCMAVSDTGIGIPPDKQSSIFDRFSQVDQEDSRVNGGTGLGLAISYAVITAMGGEILVKSKPGEGATFEVQLDLGVLESATDIKDEITYEITVDPGTVDLQDTVAEEPSSWGRDRFRTRATEDVRVLLVEDNPVNQRVTSAMLERLGCMVDVASDGPEGVALAKLQPYDLIFMDCNLPSLDGFVAARQIRQVAPNGEVVPIVALTTDRMANARQRARLAGMSDYLTKPVTLDALRNVIVAWAEASHARQT